MVSVALLDRGDIKWRSVLHTLMFQYFFLWGKDLDFFTRVLKFSVVSQTVLILGQLSFVYICMYHTLGFFEEISEKILKSITQIP